MLYHISPITFHCSHPNLILNNTPASPISFTLCNTLGDTPCPGICIHCVSSFARWGPISATCGDKQPRSAVSRDAASVISITLAILHHH